MFRPPVSRARLRTLAAGLAIALLLDWRHARISHRAAGGTSRAGGSSWRTASAQQAAPLRPQGPATSMPPADALCGGA